MSASIRGHFVWHELMTTDAAAAQDFYTKVVGWGTQHSGDGGSYTLWTSGDRPSGGCMALPPELRQSGVPPHWLTYIGTPDVDATCGQLTRLGGAVHRAPWDIPAVGRVAVAADPQGAAFCLFRPADDSAAPAGPPREGDFSWHELATTHPEAAFSFYGALFGWAKCGEFEMGPGDVYQMFGLGPEPMGGVYRKPVEVPVPNWLPYALVRSADAVAERAKALGATIVAGPMEVPGGDRVAIAIDPQGAVFAVHSRGR